MWQAMEAVGSLGWRRGPKSESGCIASAIRRTVACVENAPDRQEFGSVGSFSTSARGTWQVMKPGWSVPSAREATVKQREDSH